MTSTVWKDDGDGKIPVSTITDKVVEQNVARKNGDRSVQPSEMKTMFDQTFMKPENRRDSQEAKMTEKLVINAMKMFAVEGQDGTVRCTVSLAIRSVGGDDLDEGVVASHMQRAAMRADVYSIKTNAVANALQKNDDLMGPISTFETNCVKNE